MLSHLNPLPHLAKYKGPYKVGSVEYEIPIQEIQSATPPPDSRLTTIKLRIFYPTTPSASSKQSIPWLPTPHKVWNQAYAQFMGLSERKASWLSSLPSLLSYVTIPAVQNAPLLETTTSKPYPVMLFSHGLGGNFNTYSSLLGSLASCGIVCVAAEHRDGSAPISLIKSSRDKIETTISYKKVAHSPTLEVLNARNTMLRTRLWESSLIFSAISQINQGKQFTNFADSVSVGSNVPNFQNALDLRPGRVTWAGHSFGSATTVQLVKSIYYHQYTPQTHANPSQHEEWDMTPLYTPPADSELVKQVTTESPVVLLDLWTMPLRGTATRWLWEKPLPCYDRQSTSLHTTVLSVMSAEFYKWPDLRNRTRAVLAPSPNGKIASFEQVNPGSAELKATNELSQTISRDAFNTQQPSTLSSSQHTTSNELSQPPAKQELNEPVEPELMPVPTNPETIIPNTPPKTRDSSPAQPSNEPSTTTSSTSPTTGTTSTSPVLLYHVSASAHLSQSDFGPLFPNLIKYFMKAIEPEKTLELNIRAILAMMRGCGLPAKSLHSTVDDDDEQRGQIDRILEQGVVVDRWEKVEI